MRTALVLVFTAPVVGLLASCSDQNANAEHQRLQGEIDSLSARMSALESAPATATSGSWILWQRFDVVKTTVLITGLAPARPMGAFSSQKECEQAAQQIAEQQGAKPGATEYLQSTSTGVDRVFYTCFPKGVEVQR